MSISEILTKVAILYNKHVELDSLYDYIRGSAIATISNISFRAYDVSEPPDNSKNYAKCDEERLWLSRVCCAWITSRRNLEHKIVSLDVDVDAYDHIDKKIGPVLEIEYVLGYGFILLDVLMDQNQTISSASRSI